MSQASTYATVHIDVELRNDQNAEDLFEFQVSSGQIRGEYYWLNAAEVRGLRDQLDAALRAHEQADAVLDGAVESTDLLQRLLEVGEQLVADVAAGSFSDESLKNELAAVRLALRRSKAGVA